MPRNFSLAFPLALLCSVIAIPALAGAPALVQRAFVSGKGDNLNVATSCAVTTPCKTFAGALPVVADKGEIVALDSAAYGSVTLAQSVSITAPTGIYAGISVFAGSGITINTPNITVVLRGITINGQGGANGILVDALGTGSILSVENCVIANFTDSGVFANANAVSNNPSANVSIVNTVIRDNGKGIRLNNGAIANISNSQILRSAQGIVAINSSNFPTTVVISDTIVSGSSPVLGDGIIAIPSTGSTAKISVTRSTVTNFFNGIMAYNGSGGTPEVNVSASLVTGNSIGLDNIGSTLRATSDNMIINNSSNFSGTITVIPPLTLPPI